MNINIQGTGLDVSPKMRAYVEQKLDDSFRAFGDMNLEPVKVEVELERTTRRHPKERDDEQLYRAEATITIPGRTIRVEGTAPTLNQAVVRLKHTLTREIRRWREKLIAERRQGGRDLKEDIVRRGEAEVVPEDE
ncbi:MAG: ribosome-associated translation inhibitor RaiA [Rhodothermales bacterium]